MPNHLPGWLQAVGVLATPGIALVVAGIALGQWRTARAKLALDLFEHRLAVYSKVSAVIASVMATGRPEGHQPFNELHAARDQAQFLFGPEVIAYIRELLGTMARLKLAHQQMELGDDFGLPAGSNNWPQMILDDTTKITAAMNTWPELLQPYMGMREKLPTRLVDWFRLRHHKRRVGSSRSGGGLKGH